MTTVCYRPGIIAADRQVTCSNVTYGAMAMGAAAPRAVKIVSRFDVFTGWIVNQLSLSDG